MPPNDTALFAREPQDRSPLYLQLARDLAVAIRAGRYLPNEALPSERVLAEMMNVSRVTARAAIDQLVEQGLIIKRRGSGNYITPKIEQPLSRLTSFSEELQRRGFSPSSVWLKRIIVTGQHEELLALNLPTNALVARLERLRLADGVVMAYEVSVLPQAAVPDPKCVEHSLYQFLDQTRQAPHRAEQHIRAMNATGQLAERLGVPDRQALLFISRVAFLATGAPVEYTLSYCRSDYYDFVAEMRRDS